MLHEFLTTHRQTLITRCREKVAKRIEARPGAAELQHGIPLFLEQLVHTLRIEETGTELESHDMSGPSEPGKTPVYSAIGMSAARHGNELLRHGFTIDQVVHDYGDLCQAITELSTERAEPVTTGEFRTLNRCLDNAIADAVTEFARQREALISTEGADAMAQRLGALAHELRNLLNSAMLAVVAIKAGGVGMAGATGAVLDRSLIGLRDVVDRSLTDVRLAVGMAAPRERIELAELIAEVQVAATLEAKSRSCALTVCPVEEGYAVDADRQLLSAAVANLLQNAFKFTRPHGHVTLKTHAAAGRILIEVADECGGLPPGMAENLFQPFEQHGTDRTGLGLGLSIARRSVEANGGEIRVRDLPGTGCIFTIDLPLRAETAAHERMTQA